jgi:hypothetical protein
LLYEIDHFGPPNNINNLILLTNENDMQLLMCKAMKFSR